MLLRQADEIVGRSAPGGGSRSSLSKPSLIARTLRSILLMQGRRPLMYYRVAIRGNNASAWKWTSSVLSWLDMNDLVLVAEVAGHRRVETMRPYSLPSAEDRGRVMEGI